jgi:hypothetical protein
MSISKGSGGQLRSHRPSKGFGAEFPRGFNRVRFPLRLYDNGETMVISLEGVSRIGKSVFVGTGLNPGMVDQGDNFTLFFKRSWLVFYKSMNWEIFFLLTNGAVQEGYLFDGDWPGRLVHGVQQLDLISG